MKTREQDKERSREKRGNVVLECTRCRIQEAARHFFTEKASLTLGKQGIACLRSSGTPLPQQSL